MEKQDYIFEMPLRVRDYEVDSQGIVNNAIYLDYIATSSAAGPAHRSAPCSSRALTP